MTIDALDLVNNRAADGPLIKTYLSHTERVRKSAPNNAYDECNMIPPSVRLSESKMSVKNSLRKLVRTFFIEKFMEL